MNKYLSFFSLFILSLVISCQKNEYVENLTSKSSVENIQKGFILEQGTVSYITDGYSYTFVTPTEAYFNENTSSSSFVENDSYLGNEDELFSFNYNGDNIECEYAYWDRDDYYNESGILISYLVIAGFDYDEGYVIYLVHSLTNYFNSVGYIGKIDDEYINLIVEGSVDINLSEYSEKEISGTFVMMIQNYGTNPGLQEMVSGKFSKVQLYMF